MWVGQSTHHMLFKNKQTVILQITMVNDGIEDQMEAAYI